MGDFNKKDGLQLQGFIDLELINKKDNIKRRYHNTITKSGKQFLLDKSAGRMLDTGADMFGSMCTLGNLNKIGAYNSPGVISNSESCLTNALLNLGDLQTGLTENSTTVNLYNDDYTKREKVVGYANNNISPASDGKEGTLDYCKGEYVLDGSITCKRWKYPEGVATGTFDTIAMMPADVLKTDNGAGFRISKCIDKVNLQYTNYVNMSTGFLIPGVPGYTANDEILLNFNQDNCSRWKFSLTSGEITKVNDEDNFFVVENNADMGVLNDMVVIDNYLYVLRNYIRGDNQAYVYVYDLNNNMNKVAYFYNESTYYVSSYKFLKYNDNLYITTGYRDESITSGYTRYNINKLSKGGTSYYSSCETGQDNYESIGLVLPSGMDYRKVALSNYGNSYILISHLDSIYNRTSEYYDLKGIIFSSFDNVIGTISGKIPHLNYNSVLFSAGSNKGVLSIGACYNTDAKSDYSAYIDNNDYNKSIYNNNNKDSAKKIYTYDVGVYLSLDGWFGDLFSFVKLTTPITKSDSDILYVSYGYKVV